MTDKKNQRFTFDAENDGAKVPTLTSLLYKKNVVKSAGSPGQTQRGGLHNDRDDQSRITSLDPTLTMDTSATPTPEVIHPQVTEMRASAPSMGASAQAAPEKRVIASKAPYEPPTVLPVTPLAGYPASSVAAPGVQYLFNQAKASQVLVFQLAGEATLASATIVGDAQDRAPIWSGMSFAKEDFADLWGRLEKYSFAEFSTLGVAGQGNFDRAAFRTAFQARAHEWLTFLRVRQSTGGEALLVVFSEASLQAHIPHFHTACMGKPAAKAA